MSIDNTSKDLFLQFTDAFVPLYVCNDSTDIYGRKSGLHNHVGNLKLQYIHFKIAHFCLYKFSSVAMFPKSTQCSGV